MATFIIADLRLFDEEQMEKLGYYSMHQMNESIIRSWNQTVSENDQVIIMGNVGCGDIEQMKSVISQLNGELTITARDLNTKFTKAQWREIGFSHFWGVSMFKTFPEGKTVLYPIKKINVIEVYEKEYDLLVVDSMNPIEGMTEGIMLSADAAKWGYFPLDTDKLFEIYANMKEFEQMEETTERRSDVVEEN